MMGKIFKITANTVLFLLIIFGVLLACSFLPLPGNFRAFVVQSGSMEPTVRTGSLIFVKPSGSYVVGDIINIVNGKSSVTHRVVGKKDENGTTVFETKGDANEDVDAETVPQGKIFGKMLWSVPFVGYPIGYAKTQMGFLLLVIIPSVIIVYEELRKIGGEVAKKFSKEKAEGEPIIGNVAYIDGFSRSSDADRPMVENIQFLRQYEIVNQPKKRRKMDL